MRFEIIVAATIAAFIVLTSPSLANGVSCNPATPKALESIGFNALEDDDVAELAVLDEHQILFVKDWRLVLSGGLISTANPTKVAGLAAFITGNPSPSSEVTNAVIEFVPTGAPIRTPTYNAKRKQIRIYVTVEHYASFEKIVSVCAPIYMQYRRYPNGHVFADIHMGSVPVGN